MRGISCIRPCAPLLDTGARVEGRLDANHRFDEIGVHAVAGGDLTDLLAVAGAHGVGKPEPALSGPGQGAYSFEAWIRRRIGEMRDAILVHAPIQRGGMRGGARAVRRVRVPRAASQSTMKRT